MYVVDYDAVNEARDILGLEDEVEIWWRYMRCTSGRYHYRPNGKHRITIADAHRFMPSTASKVGWHELTHALQCERLGETMMGIQYWAEMDELGIPRSSIQHGNVPDERMRQMPMEAEAIANEVRAKDLQLVKWHKSKSKTLRQSSLNVEELIEGI